MFDESSPYKGKVTAYDSPIYIADAALYLMKTQPDLGIKNPYELDEAQFTAAVDLLKKQRGLIGEYWSDYTKEQAAFTSGDSVLGTTWQIITNLLEGEKVPVKAILPKEGATGWSDTWMISSKAKHPNCMYMWMDHIISPEANAQVAEWFGEAPANAKSCDLTADRPLHDVSTPTTRPTSTRCGTGRRRSPTAATSRGRGLQGLLRVGPGLDGDQGLIPDTAGIDGARDRCGGPGAGAPDERSDDTAAPERPRRGPARALARWLHGTRWVQLARCWPRRWAGS